MFSRGMKGSLHIGICRRGTEQEHSNTGMVHKQSKCPVLPINALLSNLTKLVVARLQAL